MRVGIPTEIKVQEFRVGITPAGVHALKEAGHTVLVQKRWPRQHDHRRRVCRRRRSDGCYRQGMLGLRHGRESEGTPGS